MEKEEFLSKYKLLLDEVLEMMKNNNEYDYTDLVPEAFEVAEEIISSINNDYKDGNYNFFYQPVAKLDSKIESCEALFRYKIYDTFINPQVVFYLLRQVNLEKDVLLHQVDKVASDTKKLVNAFGDNFRVKLNVNPQLFKPKFIVTYFEALRRNELKPQNLCIELLESSSFSNLDKNLVIELRKRGVEVLLDDFGTGYSGVDEARTIPFSKLKVAREIITGISENQQTKNSLVNILKLADYPTTSLIFEGIETKEDLTTLNSLFGNVDVQGYILSKSLPLEEFVERKSEIENNFTSEKILLDPDECVE